MEVNTSFDGLVSSPDGCSHETTVFVCLCTRDQHTNIMYFISSLFIEIILYYLLIMAQLKNNYALFREAPSNYN